MKLAEETIVERLAHSPVTSAEFEAAVKEYLRLMEEDGDLGTEHATFGMDVQEALNERFGRENGEFTELATRFGPRAVLDLFWFALEVRLGNDILPLPVPRAVMCYLSRHLSECAECREYARERATDILEEPADFDQVFALGATSPMN